VRISVSARSYDEMVTAVVIGFVDRPEGWAALEQAAQEASRREVDLVVVLSGQEPGEQDPSDALVEHVARATTVAGVASPTVIVRVMARGNSVVDDLVATIEEFAAELLVIGIRRRSSVGKFVMGSDAQRILMQSQCPVLAVKSTQ